MANNGQKTEEPTPKRLDKARKEGQFPTARQFVSAMQFLAFVAVIEAWGGEWFAELRRLMRLALAAAFSARPDAQVVEVSRDCLAGVLRLLAPAAGVLLVATLAAQLAATQLGVSLKKLAPDLQAAEPAVAAARAAQAESAGPAARAGHAAAVRAGGIRDRARQSAGLHGASLSRASNRASARSAARSQRCCGKPAAYSWYSARWTCSGSAAATARTCA